MEDENFLAEETPQEETTPELSDALDTTEDEVVVEEATDGEPQDDRLTEEERLSQEKKAKRAVRLQPLKYFLCAVSAGVIQFVSALVLKIILDKFISPELEIQFITNLKETTFIADTIGLGLSIIWNFVLNRKYTFKDVGNVPIAMCLSFLFYVPFYPFQIWYIDVIEKAIISSTGGSLEVLPFIVAQGTCMAYNFVLEFLWQKFVVFRKPKQAKQDGQN